MSKLTKAERDKLPDSAFALPGRRFPIHDANHARSALSRASEALHKGWITKAEYETVLRKAYRALDKFNKKTEKKNTQSLWSRTFTNI